MDRGKIKGSAASLPVTTAALVFSLAACVTSHFGPHRGGWMAFDSRRHGNWKTHVAPIIGSLSRRTTGKAVSIFV